jgi:hypothetical protein
MVLLLFIDKAWSEKLTDIRGKHVSITSPGSVPRIKAVEIRESCGISKYPPAKPGALRLLAPQRGLIAIGKEEENPNPMDRTGFEVQFPGTNK